MSGSETAAYLFLTILAAGVLTWVVADVWLTAAQDRRRGRLLKELTPDFRDNRRGRRA